MVLQWHDMKPTSGQHVTKIDNVCTYHPCLESCVIASRHGAIVGVDRDGTDDSVRMCEFGRVTIVNASRGSGGVVMQVVGVDVAIGVVVASCQVVNLAVDLSMDDVATDRVVVAARRVAIVSRIGGVDAIGVVMHFILLSVRRISMVGPLCKIRRRVVHPPNQQHRSLVGEIGRSPWSWPTLPSFSMASCCMGSSFVVSCPANFIRCSVLWLSHIRKR